MSISRAIATAVSQVKRWARGGEDVSAETRAKAAKALAEWERKKARSRVSASNTVTLASNDGPKIVSRGSDAPSVAERRRMAKQGIAMPDGSFWIRNVRDLRNAIRAYGRASDEKKAAVRRHIIKRARALNAAHLIPDDWRSRSNS